MKRAIVTICDEGFGPLLSRWISAVKKVSDLPMIALCLDGFRPDHNIDGLMLITVNPNGNPFQTDIAHVYAEKLRIFQHIPKFVSEILFLDLDVLLLERFWKTRDYFDMSKEKLVICPDLFVGYKEKMGDEFQAYDQTFHMQFNPDRSYFYFNTGVFFASREIHAKWFEKFLDIWIDYVRVIKKHPLLYDQHLINYGLTKYGLAVHQMSILNNCLRQYEIQNVRDGNILLNEKKIRAYHFNGGDCEKKVGRWVNMLKNMGVKHGAS